MHYGKWFASLLFAAVSILSTAAFANTTDTDNDGVLDIATWVQRGSDIDGEAAGDRSGCSVSLSADGSMVAIGALATTVMAAMPAMCGSMLGMVRAGCSAGLTLTVRRREIEAALGLVIRGRLDGGHRGLWQRR